MDQRNSTVSSTFPKPHTHIESIQRQDFRSEVRNTQLLWRGKWHEKMKKRVKNQNGERWATTQIYSTSCWFPFFATTKAATKARTSGYTVEDGWRRAYRNHKVQRGRAWALRMPIPGSFCRKRPPYSVSPQLQGQGPLMNAWEYLDSFNSRAFPQLHLHIQH